MNNDNDSEHTVPADDALKSKEFLGSSLTRFDCARLHALHQNEIQVKVSVLMQWRRPHHVQFVRTMTKVCIKETASKGNPTKLNLFFIGKVTKML